MSEGIVLAASVNAMEGPGNFRGPLGGHSFVREIFEKNLAEGAVLFTKPSTPIAMCWIGSPAAIARAALTVAEAIFYDCMELPETSNGFRPAVGIAIAAGPLSSVTLPPAGEVQIIGTAYGLAVGLAKSVPRTCIMMPSEMAVHAKVHPVFLRAVGSVKIRQGNATVFEYWPPEE